MKVSLIVAADLGGGIGFQGGIPWEIPSDMARFKRLTMGKVIIMGRKTHESIGRALPGRLNIVVSNTFGLVFPEGVRRTSSWASAIDIAKASGAGEAFAIGGGGIYRAALLAHYRVPIVTAIHLTSVIGLYPADTYMPHIHSEDMDRGGWRVTTTETEMPVPAQNLPMSVYTRLEREEPAR